MRDWLRALTVPLCAVTGLALSACAMSMEGAGEPCLEDSQACIQQRVGLVNAMASDPQRGWIGQPVSRTTVASGVRLFAYAKTKASLSCQELAAGVREMEEARKSLAQGPMPGQTAERHNQIKALTADTHAELARTRKSKCGA